MKAIKQLAIPCLLIALFAVGIVKMFGTTVSSKFSQANSSVVDQVNFGGPSYHSTSVARSNPAPVPSYEASAEPEVVGTPTTVDHLSTFAIDVDTGSYTLTRRALEGGWVPDASSIRAEEFLNYFTYAYARPPAGATSSVQLEAAPSPFSETGRTHLLRIGLQARELTERVPVHLTFLVDVSGSMGGPDRLDVAKQAILVAVGQLEPADTVAVVTYASRNEVILEPTAVRQRQRIRRVVEGLQAGGGTQMDSGMNLAYQIAAGKAGPGRVSRIIVMSDGDANIGSTTPHEILAQVRSQVNEGVTLSTVGFGTGNYNDALMEQLADAGNGNYIYIDSLAEVPLAFGDRLASMLHVVAKDVKVQVDFDADAVVSWRQLGYDNRQLADHEFRDDRVDAGEMGAGHQVTALYEVTLREGLSAQAPVATVRFRHKDVDGYAAKEAATVFRAGAIRNRIGDTSDDFRFQAAVAAFALNLKGEERPNVDWIEEVARTGLDGRSERLRFVDLVRRAAELRGQM